MLRLIVSLPLILYCSTSILLAEKPKYGPAATPRAIPLSVDHSSLSVGPQPDFWTLIPFYIGQMNECSCSVAVATMLLNAFISQQPQTSDLRYLTQKDLLKKMSKSIWPQRVRPTNCRGVGLLEFESLIQQALSLYKVGKCNTQSRQISDLNSKVKQDFRAALDRNQSSNRNFIVLNIDQKLFTDDTSAGHFVVIGAWDDSKERVLILDPDRDWYQPYWVSFDTTLRAMNTQDLKEKTFRGWIEVSCE